jgi:large subunit ribosomal protein L10
MSHEQGDLMARPDKVAVVDEVRDRLSSSAATVLTEYRGLTVTELADLRAELRKNDAEYKVVKNTLARIAAKDAGLEVPDELLVGPTAVTFVAGDPVAVAKVLRTFSKDHPELVVKGSILDGKLLDAADTLRLADLESREELLARLAGMFEAVVAQPARLALANLTKAARLLAALQAKRVESGETMQEAPAAEAPAAEAPAPEATAEAGDAEPSPPAEEQPSARAAEGGSGSEPGVVGETPEPDSPAAEAVTAEATARAAEGGSGSDQAAEGVDATPADAEPASKPGASETE